MNDNIIFLRLHNSEVTIKEVFDLLSQNFKRSFSAWEASLQKKTIYPQKEHLVLLKNHKLIGFCTINQVNETNEKSEVAVLVTNDENLRNQGLGRLLMENLEAYVKLIQIDETPTINTIYLSTKDKQEFYRHLGYQNCDSVKTKNQIFQKISTKEETKEETILEIEDTSTKQNLVPKSSFIPPAPMLPKITISKTKDSELDTWMKKLI